MLARPSEAPRRAEVPPPVFVALVTGAASGIGRATALRLAGSGAALALLDRDADGVAAVADEALDAGAADALTFAADVASADGVERAFAEATDRLGPLDALACAAGILEPAGLAVTTADTKFLCLITEDFTYKCSSTYCTTVCLTYCNNFLNLIWRNTCSDRTICC